MKNVIFFVFLVACVLIAPPTSARLNTTYVFASIFEYSGEGACEPHYDERGPNSEPWPWPHIEPFIWPRVPRNILKRFPEILNVEHGMLTIFMRHQHFDISGKFTLDYYHQRYLTQDWRTLMFAVDLTDYTVRLPKHRGELLAGKRELNMGKNEGIGDWMQQSGFPWWDPLQFENKTYCGIIYSFGQLNKREISKLKGSFQTRLGRTSITVTGDQVKIQARTMCCQDGEFTQFVTE